MADQKRWFKLWCSAPSDDDLLALPLELRWAWAVLGCYTKEHGTRGRVKITPSNVVLAAQMGVSVLVLKETITLLPHVRIEEGKSDNGAFTVTWENWTKYQEDSTIAERVARLRSKRRGEEMRRDKTRTTPPVSTPPLAWTNPQLEAFVLACPAPYAAQWTDPSWWESITDAYPRLDLPREASAYMAWNQARNGHAQHQNLKRGLRNWFAKAAAIAEQRAMGQRFRP